jgi:hypothetical protein
MREPILVFLVLAVSQLLAGAQSVTFHKDVEPLLQKHCQGCHRPGEAAPFSLLQYKDARPWAKAIREAVQLRKMPPWFADPAHGKFANDRRLSPAEIATIRAWVDQGAPEGNAADAPPPLSFVDDWKIGTPDLVVELPVRFPVPAEGTIDYTWFASDMKLTEDKWIEKIEVRPSDRTVVHHALVFARPPESKFRADLQPGNFTPRPEVKKPNSKPQTDSAAFAIGNGFGQGVEMIGDYVVNGDPFVAAPGQARLVRAGSHMLFQMHYTSSGRATTDRTRVGIVFAKTPPKERVVNDAVMNTTLRIPPGAANHQVQGTVTFLHDTMIGGFGPHMHVRGKAMRYELLRSEGQTPETLLYVPEYNFNWQLKYVPAKWVPVKKGDKLRITAWYDNSPNNRWNPDPTREVLWGDQSWDEMLFAFFDFVIPADSDPALVTGGKQKPPAAAAESASR